MNFKTDEEEKEQTLFSFSTCNKYWHNYGSLTGEPETLTYSWKSKFAQNVHSIYATTPMDGARTNSLEKHR